MRSAILPPQEVVDDIGRTERMIARLLTYVPGEDVIWVTEPVDLADDEEDGLRRQHLAGPDVSLRARGKHRVLANRDQLDRALANLIGNAVVHKCGSDIEVFSSAGVAICTIDNNDPGLTPEENEAVFRAFSPA